MLAYQRSSCKILPSLVTFLKDAANRRGEKGGRDWTMYVSVICYTIRIELQHRLPDRVRSVALSIPDDKRDEQQNNGRDY
jgi:hypothetical protein